MEPSDHIFQLGLATAIKVPSTGLPRKTNLIESTFAAIHHRVD